MTRRTALLVAGSFTAVVACGSGNLYSASDLEAAIVESQKPALEALAVGVASCPEDVVLREGAEVECTLDIESEQARYRAILTDVAAKDVTVSVQPLDIVVPTAAAADYVTENLEAEVEGADVTCGEEGAVVVVAQTGDTFTCTVGVGSQTTEVELEVVDEQGTVAIVS